MARYYFIVHDIHGKADDDEGLELPDLASAQTQAIASARSMMCDSIRHGELDFTAFIQIEDEERESVQTLSFREAVSIRR